MMYVLDENTLRNIMGGLDQNDCMWRCFAYLNSCGTNYGAYDAESLASNYYGSSFNSSDYGFTGSQYDANSLGSGVLGALWDDPTRQKILVFNPNQISNWQGDGSSVHAVIVVGLNATGDKWIVHDAQNGQDGEISVHELANSTGGYFL